LAEDIVEQVGHGAQCTPKAESCKEQVPSNQRGLKIQLVLFVEIPWPKNHEQDVQRQTQHQNPNFVINDIDHRDATVAEYIEVILEGKWVQRFEHREDFK